MSRTRMTVPFFILSELFPLDGFRCNFVEYNHDTSQLCRTGHGNVFRTRMTTLIFVLSELSSLDG